MISSDEIDMESHIKNARLRRLPEALRRELKEARRKRGWSQAALGQRTGLPQMHISGIETGKIVPRFDTLLDLVRVLDRDLLMIPRALVPAVQALIRDHHRQDGGDHPDDGERPLYAVDDGEQEEDRRDED
jgi:transcriptional regulator with XRE-family HTH domain